MIQAIHPYGGEMIHVRRVCSLKGSLAIKAALPPVANAIKNY